MDIKASSARESSSLVNYDRFDPDHRPSRCSEKCRAYSSWTICVLFIIAAIGVMIWAFIGPTGCQNTSTDQVDRQDINFDCPRPAQNCTLMRHVVNTFPTDWCSPLPDMAEMENETMALVLDRNSPRRSEVLQMCEDGTLIPLHHINDDGSVDSFMLTMGYFDGADKDGNVHIPVYLYQFDCLFNATPPYSDPHVAADQHGFADMHITLRNFASDPTYQAIYEIFRENYGHEINIFYDFRIGWRAPSNSTCTISLVDDSQDDDRAHNEENAANANEVFRLT